jgi:hypothetical protein
MTMMPDPWFEIATSETSLTQGDLIANCPLLGWRQGASNSLDAVDATFDLAELADSFTTDVVVMTQACDLEQQKVSNVVLCPAVAISAFHESWEKQRHLSGQAPTAKSWNRELVDIASGRIWNLSLLNSFGDGSTTTEIRVVFFDQVFTLPRNFIEGLLRRRGQSRLRLRPPYREHLSQSFARYFMRVGLPQAIDLPV